MGYKLTLETKQQFEAELKELKTDGRANAVKKIQEARAFGDLSENAEYDIAKDDQGKLEARIRELEDILRNCEIIQINKSSETVELGSTVDVKDGAGVVKTYVIVGVYESDPLATPKKISNESPLGKTLYGRKKGDKVNFEHKGKTEKLEIVKIS